MTDLTRTLKYLEQHPDFVCLDELPNLKIELRYATSDNFMGRAVYGDFKAAFLHRLAAEKLSRASELLVRENPGYRFLVLDALRPRSMQRVLWSHVVGTPDERYVANPDRGGMHNFGCAIDITVIDRSGAELDMGSGFDAFIALSQPQLEEKHLLAGELTKAQVENRMILRRAMTEAGFLQLQHEWWHYDAFPQTQVREQFTIIE